MIFLLCLLVLRTVDIGSSELQPRVFNGNIAREGQFSYLVGISIHSGLRSSWCGGSIISNEWILTAAHCFNRMSRGSVGYIYYGSTLREQGEKVYFRYRNVVRHPEFSQPRNDLALVKTPRIRFSKYVRAIPLPSAKDTSHSYANQQAIAAGWNRKKINGPEQLMWTEVTITHYLECPKKYSEQGESICGRVKNGSSICLGDSGGPLVHLEKRTLVGVTSYIKKGSNCDNGDVVGFANVLKYLPWIKKVSGVVPPS